VTPLTNPGVNIEIPPSESVHDAVVATCAPVTTAKVAIPVVFTYFLEAE
jgi:hypothetical protein